ncbi:class I SAM-dependent methyltransferase [Methanothrix harundinacea]|uniref:UbiE/COQ5 methyltransferase n=1 Tax=Methanothrix harundinacea (strain 6Ac) TaxID=1110509 RepID=G7WRH7_METH6|nr:class I SAM-dependent methyltransferase [Methanothrix harundinacea]AET65718.1 UbiE/COQ5 methyltransferase [Methanothrix harundinacea 6Ac]
MFGEIGTVRNFVEAGDLQHLALFKDSISEIQLKEGEDPSAYFSPEFSHYIVAHDPLDGLLKEYGEEWSRRFSGRLGVSIVERIGAGEGAIYVRGLMAQNGSKVYLVLPYTSIDAAASMGATFTDPRPISARRRVWPEVLPELKGERILDVGCGFGRLTLDVASQSPASEVFGIDLFDPLTAQARMNAEALGIKNAEFRTASVYDLPFEGGSFETVYSFFMLHHLEDIPKGLFEIRRVLARGGRYLAVEPLGHHHGPNHSGADWLRIFEDAGLPAGAEEKEGAVILRARKGDQKIER